MEFVAGLNPISNETDSVIVEDSLNIFSKAKVSKDILASDFIQIFPNESVIKQAPVLNFTIQKTIMPFYLNMNQTFVSLEVAIKKINTLTGEKSDISMDDNVAPIAHLQDTLFKVCNLVNFTSS